VSLRVTAGGENRIKKGFWEKRKKTARLGSVKIPRRDETWRFAGKKKKEKDDIKYPRRPSKQERGRVIGGHRCTAGQS